MKFLASLLFLVITYSHSGAQITVKPYMVFNLNGLKEKNIWRCFDGNTDTQIDITGGANDWFMSLPFSSFIVLDSISDITGISYYVSNNMGGNLKMSFYDVNKKRIGSHLILTAKGYYRDWVNVKTSRANVRFMEISATEQRDLTDGFMEIRLLGKGKSRAPSILPSASTAQRQDPGIDAHGVNILDDRLMHRDSTEKPILPMLAKWIRFIYEGVRFDYYPDTYRGRLVESPIWLGRFGPDHVSQRFRMLRQWNIKAMMSKSGGSIKGLAEADARKNEGWLGSAPGAGKKYLEPGADAGADSGWIPLGEQYFKLISLFSANKNADLSGFSVIGGNGAAGQNLFHAFESDNEPNRWWDTEYYHSPENYYRALKAIYARGKAADPNAPIFAAALPGLEYEYWKALFFLHFWEQGFAPFPADGLNFNMYMNNARLGQRRGEFGISPESFGLFQEMQEIEKFFSTYFPGKQVQWTEFGYATADDSPYDVNAIGNKPERHVQADWTLRVKALAQTTPALLRIFYYTFFEDFTVPFNTMALVQDQFSNKGVYTYSRLIPTAYALANELYIEKDYDFYSTVIVNGGSTGAWVTRKDHRTTKNKKLYKLWMGTSNDSSIHEFTLNIPGAKKARLFKLSYNSYTPEVSNIAVTRGSISIPVTEAMSWVEVER
jgi:hypothetical protein